ncbi:MAG TPA: DUF4350 domain-containing protein [Acidimicrobiia bacterium]|nr:DUF4350 domain-containing protein [Acidimicrobiia bacterium]
MSDTTMRWTRMHPAARAAVVVTALVIVVVVALAALDSATRGAQNGGPDSSSLSTATSGTAAYAELLARAGHRVMHQRGSLAGAHLDPSTTLVLLDPDQVDRADLDTVRSFVLRGGHLVAGGRDPEWILELAPEDVPGWTPHGTRTVRVTTPDGDALQVRTDGSGSWVEPHGVRALTFSPARSEGRAVLLADASPLQNRLLDQADNAAFGLALAPAGQPVVFAEGVHGYSGATGLAAIPSRWKVALVTVALAALLAMVAAGRRLGPPEDRARELPPRRRAYVDALASTLARTRRPAEALAPVQREMRTRVAQHAGLEPDASPDAVRDAARTLGWDVEEVDALYAPLDDDRHVLAAGRALARESANRGTSTRDDRRANAGSTT